MNIKKGCFAGGCLGCGGTALLFLWFFYTIGSAMKAPAPADRSPVARQTKPVKAKQAAPNKAMPKEVEAYLSATEGDIKLIRDALASLEKTYTAGANNPLLVKNRDWQLSAGVSCGVLKSSGKALAKVKTAPEGCAFVQRRVVEIAALSQQIADDFIDGVDHNRDDRMNAAARKMEKAHEVAGELADSVQILRDRYK